MKVRISGAALAAATVFALAACSSSGTTSSGAAQPKSNGSTSATTGGAGAAQPVDVCTVLPAAKAAELSGQPYTTAVSTGAAEGWTSGCAYNNDDSTAEGVNVNLDTSGKGPDTWTVVHTGSISDISGLGDKAFWDNDNTLYVMSGSAIIQVNGLDSQDESEALAKVVLDAMH